jgi:hypothetical protein
MDEKGGGGSEHDDLSVCGVGFIQRFSLGFRGPLCLVCGFTNVPAPHFLGGVAVGALGTMPIQLFVVTPSPSFPIRF